MKNFWYVTLMLHLHVKAQKISTIFFLSVCEVLPIKGTEKQDLK